MCMEGLIIRPSRRTDKVVEPKAPVSPYLNKPILKGRVFKVSLKLNGYTRSVECYEHSTLKDVVMSAIRGIKVSKGVELNPLTIHNLQYVGGPAVCHSAKKLSDKPVVGGEYSVKVNKIPKGSPSSIGRVAIGALAVG